MLILAPKYRPMLKQGSSIPKIPFFLLLLLSLFSQAISQTLDEERSILLLLKQGLGGPPSLPAWNSSSSPCHWPEINCAQDAVVAISLRNMTITRQVPPTTCHLQHLILLDLSHNAIPGPFPDILNCSRLQYLFLSHNSFVGPIPPDIHRLSLLRFLDLSDNFFSGDIPPELGRLRELQFLLLAQNEFNGTWPVEFSNLSSLQHLAMAYNDRFLPSAIPKEFGTLKKLKFLRLTDCNLIGGIPESFNNLRSLEHLDLSRNTLEGTIPGGLLMLENLTHLFLCNNGLSSNIPPSIGALNLEDIDLSDNNLSGPIPEGFGNLQDLMVLNLFWNRLSGQIPPNISFIPKLMTFRVFGNQLSGVMPSEFGLHSELREFEVSENKLSGELPQHLCARGDLLGLVASSNNLSGEVPKSLGNCSSLLTIQLSNNGFSGEIPTGIWTSPNMIWLMIGGNSFSGALPSELASSLVRLEIANNMFSGPIPAAILSWTNVRVLKASNNMLSGKIPLELTTLGNLTSLLLDGNQLWGELPSTIISWESLDNLDLSRNKVSGLIPNALGSLPTLSYLNLSKNQLRGPVPPELGHLKLNALDLSSNQLSGVVPTVFQNEAYEDSFLNNPKLCASFPRLKLPPCDARAADSNKLSTKHLVAILISALIGFLIPVFFIWLIVRARGRNRGDSTTWAVTRFQRVNFDIQHIVSSMTENNEIGNGSAGKVYRIPASNNSGSEEVAVKSICNDKKLDDDLLKEFRAEVDILSSIRHSNIVKLFCCISYEKLNLLVYEYMENRCLHTRLHGNRRREASTSGPHPDRNSVLDWPRRLSIAIGAAKGLVYMHEDCRHPIIHRDVKSKNILLDADFNAKIGDFGFAKRLAKQGEANIMSTCVGTFGYIAPEYPSTGQANEKIDVYSFGVVLLELVTGRESVWVEHGQNVPLAKWAREYAQKIPIQDVVDVEIKEDCDIEQVRDVFETGLWCTKKLSKRPTIREVLEILRRCQEGTARNKDHQAAPLLPDATQKHSELHPCSIEMV